MIMIRKISVMALAATLLFVAGCSTTGPSPRGGTAERRATMETATDEALANLRRQVSGSGQLLNSAKGVLVFPNVLEAGFVFGASRGEGVLRVGGKTISRHRTTSGSWGLQAGAQSTAVFVLFMTDQSLRQFQSSSGWSVGVDANVTVVSVGANAQISTDTAQQPIIGFVLSNSGLMAGLTMNGTRVTRIDR
jgi:lipid-binding SYLF domain-containing protein